MCIDSITDLVESAAASNAMSILIGLEPVDQIAVGELSVSGIILPNGYPNEQTAKSHSRPSIGRRHRMPINCARL